jgi:hypothetical protein
VANGSTDMMEIAGGPPSMPARDVPVGGLPLAKLCRVTAYIENNLHRALRLIELGVVAHMSPYHLARLFKTATAYRAGRAAGHSGPAIPPARTSTGTQSSSP